MDSGTSQREVMVARGPDAGPGEVRLAVTPPRGLRARYDIVALVLRLALGGVIFPHGARKLLGWFGGAGLHETLAGFQQQLGLPTALAVLVVVAEFCGSLGVVTGTLTRWAAFGIGSVMTGAIVLRHARFGFFMNWRGTQAGEGFEYHLLALGLALALVLGGGGSWSLDAVLARRRKRPSASSAPGEE